MKTGRVLSISLFLSLLIPFSLLACERTVPIESSADQQNDATWEKAHAVYIHDLAFASLDRSNHENFQAKSDLINARMYIAYAEADQMDLRNNNAAKQDLQQSRMYIARAAQVDPNPKSQSIIHKLEKTVKLSSIDDAKSCNNAFPRKVRYSFNHVKSEIDATMLKL